MNMPTIGEMIAFHGLERRFYSRIISLGVPPSVTRNVIAIWMFLQYIGIDIMTFLSDCHDDLVIRRFVGEAVHILFCINNNNPSREASVSIPLTNALAIEELNLRFFHVNRDVVARTIGYIMAGIGTVIFDLDINNVDSNQQYDRRFGPNAMDSRSLFFTTSSSSLRESDVLGFFNRRWNNCVEHMMMEERGGLMPIYGRIVLKEEYFVDLIFHSDQILNMNIDGRVITVRKFSPN